ncbi:MAG: hypothetical protein ACRD3Q_06915 [Terriglobales bacterium]
MLTAATHAKTEIAPDMRTALHRLREKEYRAVVLDDSMSQTGSAQLDVLHKHLGMAVPVFVNFAISAKERVVRDVATALRRVDTEKQFVRRSVEWELRSQLKADLTGIMLSAQQALGTDGLPRDAETKLKSVCELADRMRLRLSAAGGD